MRSYLRCVYAERYGCLLRKMTRFPVTSPDACSSSRSRIRRTMCSSHVHNRFALADLYKRRIAAGRGRSMSPRTCSRGWTPAVRSLSAFPLGCLASLPVIVFVAGSAVPQWVSQCPQVLVFWTVSREKGSMLTKHLTCRTYVTFVWHHMVPTKPEFTYAVILGSQVDEWVRSLSFQNCFSRLRRYGRLSGVEETVPRTASGTPVGLFDQYISHL